MTVSNSTKPDQDAKDTYAKLLTNIVNIRAYAQAVTMTHLDAIDPKPSWFDGLQAKLTTAQGHDQLWQDTLEPAITSTIPQANHDYARKFKHAKDHITQILSDSNNKPTATQVADIVQNVNDLKTVLGTIDTNITTLQGQFKTFVDNAHSDFQALSDGADDIQKAIDWDTTDEVNLQADMTKQQANIDTDNAAIMAASIAMGVGLVAGVGIGFLGAAASGPAAPVAIVVGIFIGVASVAEEASVLGVYETRLADAQDAYTTDSQKYDNDKKQKASLMLMKAAIDNLDGKNTAMQNSLTQMQDWWKMINTKLAAVITDITNAAKDDSSSNWSSLKDDLDDANDDWQDYAKFADEFQSQVTSINVVTVTPKKSAAA